MSIRDNYLTVMENIAAACAQCGRGEGEVKLITVTKFVDTGRIAEAVAAGARHVGENRAQEFRDKLDFFKENGLDAHLIGQLQTNKVKYIVDKDLLIHSVDSVKLANEIQKDALKKQAHCNILLEVNVAQEASKFGFTVEEVPAAVEEISKLSNVHIQGLMTIAPFVENPEDNRVIFAKLHKLLLDIKSRNIDNVNMSVLSMGMTNDYTVAVEEGATMVRVGTGIFGARNYNI